MPGRAYYRRKRAEGKTSRQALRCLKRRLSDLIYRTLCADLANAAQQTPNPQRRRLNPPLQGSPNRRTRRDPGPKTVPSLKGWVRLTQKRHD